MLHMCLHLQHGLNGWIMGDLTFLVWKCSGLNAPHKQASPLNFLKKKRNVDIALLQEMHVLQTDTSC